MSLVATAILPAAIILALLLLYIVLRRRALRQNTAMQLLRRPGYTRLLAQVGYAIENGKRLHLSVGRGGLERAHAPTSVAALHAADTLIEASVRSNTPPDLSVGEATLLTPMQDSLQTQYQARQRPDYQPEKVAFVAPASAPLAYATGTAVLINPADIGSAVLLGHIGRELAYVAEHNQRHNITQLLGTDDPTGMAVALLYTDTPLLGEELLSAEASLKPAATNREAVVGVQVQNLLRWVVVLVLLLTAVLAFLGLDFTTLPTLIP
jgi:hypothetical protein